MGTKGSKPEREREPPPPHVMAALVAGLDRVGKRSANAREFEVSISRRDVACC